MQQFYSTRTWLVDSIIPEQSFTLIGGRSGSGKSTLVFQGIEEWLTLGTFLKYKCNRTPKFHYISFDRTIEVVHQHLDILGIKFIDETSIEWVSLQSAAEEDYSNKTFTLPSIDQGEVLILDGLDMLTPGGGIREFRHVNALCKQCITLIRKLKISVIGLIGAVKSNGNGKDESSPWDKLLGSGVWQRISETNMLMEPSNAKNIEDLNRILYIRPRFSASLRMFFAFRKDDSRLYPAPNPSSGKPFQVFLETLPDGMFTKQKAIEVGSTLSHGERTVDKLINYLVDEKYLQIMSRGKFKKAQKYLN